MSRRSPRPDVKRVYEPADASDGTRVLVDRIWPRGLTKERAGVARLSITWQNFYRQAK